MDLEQPVSRCAKTGLLLIFTGRVYLGKFLASICATTRFTGCVHLGQFLASICATTRFTGCVHRGQFLAYICATTRFTGHVHLDKFLVSICATTRLVPSNFTRQSLLICPFFPHLKHSICLGSLNGNRVASILFRISSL